MWWTKYIGLPFEEQGRGPKGYDCWGLVRLVYEEELQILLPSWAAKGREDNYDTAKVRFDAALPKFHKLDGPEDFAMALFDSSSHVFHIGVLVDKERMLHCTEGVNTCVVKWSNYIGRLKGFYKPYDQNSCSLEST